MKKKAESSIQPGKTPVSLKMIEAINDYGSVKISEKVIASVVKKAACKVPGVARLASGTFVESIATMISSTRTPESIIKLDITGNEVKIYIRINIIYGHNIPEVAIKVQNTVTDEVKFITGMDVKKVDVEIQEVEPPTVSSFKV